MRSVAIKTHIWLLYICENVGVQQKVMVLLCDTCYYGIHNNGTRFKMAEYLLNIL